MHKSFQNPEKKKFAENLIECTRPIPAIATLLGNDGVIISIDELNEIVKYLFPGFEIAATLTRLSGMKATVKLKYNEDDK